MNPEHTKKHADISWMEWDLYPLVKQCAKHITPPDVQDTVISEVWLRYRNLKRPLQKPEHWIRRAIKHAYLSELLKMPMSGRSTVWQVNEEGEHLKPAFTGLTRPDPESGKLMELQIEDTRTEHHSVGLLIDHFVLSYAIEKEILVLVELNEGINIQLEPEKIRKTAIDRFFNELEQAHLKYHLTACPKCVDIYSRIETVTWFTDHVKKVTRDWLWKSVNRTLDKLTMTDVDELLQQLEQKKKELLVHRETLEKEFQKKISEVDQDLAKLGVAPTAKRRGRPPGSGKKHSRPASSKRKCRICGQSGHNAATCEQKKTKIQKD